MGRGGIDSRYRNCLQVQKTALRSPERTTNGIRRCYMISELVLKNRSYRRFYQDTAIDFDTLRELVNLGRLSASAANLQPLKYIISCDAQRNALIFAHLTWAAYLEDWPGPVEGERPSAYIIILKDTEIKSPLSEYDCGIACQSMLLGATEKGLGGCIIYSVDRKKLQEALAISDRYEIHLVLTLGKPKEKAQIEAVGPDGDIKYWRDEQAVHHVPKRDLDDIIIG
jgi:nitroreductase